MLVLLVIVSVVDFALALIAGAVVMLILKSGGLGDTISWACIAAWCVAAPVLGFLLHSKGRTGSGVLVALTPPPLTALFLVI